MHKTCYSYKGTTKHACQICGLTADENTLRVRSSGLMSYYHQFMHYSVCKLSVGGTITSLLVVACVWLCYATYVACGQYNEMLGTYSYKTLRVKQHVEESDSEDDVATQTLYFKLHVSKRTLKLD